MHGGSLAWLIFPLHCWCSCQVTLSKPCHHSAPLSSYVQSQHGIVTLLSHENSMKWHICKCFVNYKM